MLNFSIGQTMLIFFNDDSFSWVRHYLISLKKNLSNSYLLFIETPMTCKAWSGPITATRGCLSITIHLASQQEEVGLTCVMFWNMSHQVGTGCSGKIVFFHNSLHPLPRLHRCKRPSTSQHNASVQSLLLAVNFFGQPIAGEGEVANIRKFLEKKHNI